MINKGGLFSDSFQPVFNQTSMKVLSCDQVEAYQRNGFLILQDFLDLEMCTQLRQSAQQLIHSFDASFIPSLYREYEGDIPWEEYYWKTKSSLCFFFEKAAFLPNGEFKDSKEMSVKKISYALHHEVPGFQQFAKQSKINDLLKDLGLQDPWLVQSMYLIKQPYIGSSISCHQDGSFLHSEPDTLVTLWFALTDATIENGCLGVQPKGHLQPLKFKLVRTEENGLSYEVYDNLPWEFHNMIPLEVKAGSLIILHSHTPHFSYPNQSSQQRHACSLHFISRQSRFLPSNWMRLD
jgi:phytanoyl-CoA hydroxylase